MDFRQFEALLRRTWGEDAALGRHEIYFISKRKQGWRQVLHAMAGLLRDMWICLRLPRHAPALSETVCVVSLAGASGWGTLAPVLATRQAEGDTPTVLIHPRLRGTVEGRPPLSPALADWRKALGAMFQPGQPLHGVSPWTVRCCLARRYLWRGAWRRTLAEAGSRTQTLLLHNDFDLFSATAVETAKDIPPIRSLCVQHGLPTDEFFPTRADIQLVWGESSRQVYISHGTPDSSIVTRAYRAKPPLPPRSPLPAPQRVLLLSQTHTPVFGRSLKNDFLLLARTLDRTFDDARFRILLHPEESRLGHPYAVDRLLSRCENAPHEDIIPKNIPLEDAALVVGFCSTALLEAAQAGHFVLGLHWEAPASRGAQRVGTPPRKAQDGDEVMQLFERLGKEEALRFEWMQQQADWIGSTFSPVGENGCHNFNY